MYNRFFAALKNDEIMLWDKLKIYNTNYAWKVIAHDNLVSFVKQGKGLCRRI